MFFKPGKSIDPAQVLKALSQVMDPDLGKDIVSLGFVKNVQIDQGSVSFIVELTTPACPVKEQLKAECERVVREIPGVQKVSVEMTANVRSSAKAGGQRLEIANVRNVIAVASGKGGVGKSTVALNLAVALAQTGAKVGLLDADVYGPSMPVMLGTQEKPMMDQENRIYPIESHGIKVMSMGFLVDENQPVVWRGPMVHGVLTQFLTQVEWGELDYLFIDMPPGTGDAQLTISQTAPLAGAVIVTTPQEVSLADARKGLKMFQSVNVPILGVVENMSGFVCGHCQEVTQIFLSGGGKRLADTFRVPFLGEIPLDPQVAMTGDAGTPVVQSHPKSPAATGFNALARRIASELSIQITLGRSSFQPVSLDWQ